MAGFLWRVERAVRVSLISEDRSRRHHALRGAYSTRNLTPARVDDELRRQSWQVKCKRSCSTQAAFPWLAKIGGFDCEPSRGEGGTPKIRTGCSAQRHPQSETKRFELSDDHAKTFEREAGLRGVELMHAHLGDEFHQLCGQRGSLRARHFVGELQQRSPGDVP